MRLVGAYLRQKRLGLVMLLLLFGLLAAALWLYGLPAAAIGYAALLCAFTGGIFAAVDLSRFVRRHRRLAALCEAPELPPDVLPAPDGLIERDYQALLAARREADARRAAEEARRYTGMMEYYTLWAHQIKTPIAAMKLMLRRDGEPDAAALREQLFHIERYADMVLGYLRLDSDATDLGIAEYDLDGIVRAAVRKFAPQFIRRGLRLAYEPLETRVLTDEKWLLFAVEQLLSNAIKYTPAGGVSIFMEPKKTLVIRDTGIGILPEDLPRVFDRGFTGFNGRVERASTGIGLYLCRRVLTLLGHELRLESVPGGGTTVRVRLDSARLGRE